MVSCRVFEHSCKIVVQSPIVLPVDVVGGFGHFYSKDPFRGAQGCQNRNVNSNHKINL